MVVEVTYKAMYVFRSGAILIEAEARGEEYTLVDPVGPESGLVRKFLKKAVVYPYIIYVEVS
jgi:hypothetical protein